MGVVGEGRGQVFASMGQLLKRQLQPHTPDGHCPECRHGLTRCIITGNGQSRSFRRCNNYDCPNYRRAADAFKFQPQEGEKHHDERIRNLAQATVSR